MKAKTLAQRVEEAVRVRRKLAELHVSEDDPQIKALHEVLNNFVRGTGFTGTLPIDAMDRVALVKLSLQSHVESTVVLRAKRQGAF